jgi:uncharacterized membrane protein YdjX (TVP38/TMEM64 family)/rhodanese-related sulfurtransferase
MNKRYVQLAVVVILIAAIGTGIYYRDSFDLDLLEQWLQQAGWWAPILFISIYSIAAVLFLPGSVFTLAGGVLFGPVWGTLINLTGATLGATFSFLIARYLASETVSRHAGGGLKRLINGVEAEGWRFVAFVRLVPLFPFNLLNYVLGLTRIRLVEYIISTFIFMIPGGIAYTWIGYAGREALGGSENTIKQLLIGIALLACVIFIPRLITTIRRASSIDITELKKRLDEDVSVLLDVRTSEDFSKDGLRHAINIPLEQLEQRMDKLDEYINSPIAIICTTQNRSKKAANLLIKNGFQDVSVVWGGMNAWHKSGSQ